MSPTNITDNLVSFASQVDDNTVGQAKGIASMPFVWPHVALMPDAHLGKGSSVGTVIPTKGAVIPAAVGVDIGCGMIAAKTRFNWTDDLDCCADLDLKDLREAVEDAIPLSPGNYNKNNSRFPWTRARHEELIQLADRDGVDLSHSGKWMEQLGSLGGGNHFIELCVEEEGEDPGRVWLFLHSGSRGVGNKIAQKHIKAAKHFCDKVVEVSLPDPEMAYLQEGTPQFDEYIRELGWAQRFALLNREEMMDRFAWCFARWMGVEKERVEVPGARVNCFSGETQVITRAGTRPIESLAGGQHELLTDGGEWVKAPVKHFGRQAVSEITLTRSGVTKTIRATAGHRWFLKTRRGVGYEARTDELQPGEVLVPVFSQVPEGRSVNRLAAARGFVFGDGSRQGTRSVANFCGAKDEAMIPFFEGEGNPICTYPTFKRITGLPAEWKSERPSLNSPPEILYGWLAGYFAADGDVDMTGRPTLVSSRIEDLEYVRNACQVVGVGTFGIRSYMRVTNYSHGQRVPIHMVGLMRGDLDSEFFLTIEHRRRFEISRGVAERRHWRVASVRETDEFADVYCAVVEDTHSFALADNILTSNCHHNYTVPIEIRGERVWLTRKGAIDATEGKMGLIPGSMGTASYVVRGTGNETGLFSAPHGAGRRFSRNKAKATFTLADLEAAMEGIEYRRGEAWIDEIPGAYKDIHVVMEDAKELVTIVAKLKQVMNVKGT